MIEGRRVRNENFGLHKIIEESHRAWRQITEAGEVNVRDLRRTIEQLRNAIVVLHRANKNRTDMEHLQNTVVMINRVLANEWPRTNSGG